MQHEIIILILISFIVLSAVTTNAAAEPLAEIDPDLEKQYTSLFIFENISTIISGAFGNSLSSTISPTIQSYDILEIDVPALKRKILAGEKIPVRLRGISYLMVLDTNPVVPNPETGESIYMGHFLSTTDKEIQDYLVRLSFSGDQFEGNFHDIRSDTFVYCKQIETDRPAHTLYYVYSSDDAEMTGARLDNDVWVRLPSGESILRNEMDQDQIEMYWNEQVNRERLRLNGSAAPSVEISGSLQANAAPLPLPIVFLSLGMWSIICGMVRKKW